MEDIETLAKNSTQCWIVVPPAHTGFADDGFREKLVRLVKAGATTGGHVYLLLAPPYGADDGAYFDGWRRWQAGGSTADCRVQPALSRPGAPPLAGCADMYSSPLHAGYGRLSSGGECRASSKPLADVTRLFRAFPQAVTNIQNIYRPAGFRLMIWFINIPKMRLIRRFHPSNCWKNWFGRARAGGFPARCREAGKAHSL